MCERLRNPEIRKQIIDVLVSVEEEERGIQVEIFFDKDGKERRRLNPNIPLSKNNGYIPRTMADIETELNEDIDMISLDTPVVFDGITGNTIDDTPGGREIIDLGERFLENGDAFTVKARMITESHEKGHLLRRYGSVGSRKDGIMLKSVLGEREKISARFANALDISKVDVSEEYKKIQKWYFAETGKEFSLPESMLGAMIRDYLRKPYEIAERMSQLKNYFGMQGADTFTKEHLHYAKEHYIKDIDFDNAVILFFQAITPEKEDAFIELINSAGI
jgi:hypothetical protein